MITTIIIMNVAKVVVISLTQRVTNGANALHGVPGTGANMMVCVKIKRFGFR